MNDVLKNKKSTILFVAHSADYYGAEKVLYSIMNHLQKDYEIHVAVPDTGILTEKLMALPAIHMHHISLPKFTKKPLDHFYNLVHFGTFCRNFYNLLRRVRPDVVYCNTIRNVLTVMLSRLLGYCAVWHIHEKNIPGLLGKVFSIIAACFPVRTIFISRYVMQTFVDDYPAVLNKGVIIYNGVEEMESGDALNPPLLPIKHGSQFPVLAVMAQLAPSKRIADTVSAMAAIRRNYPTALLLIMGDGILKDEINRQIIDQQLQDNVHLLGYVRDLGRIMPAVDIFLCPFEDEGFGLVAIEAMSTKKPVIAAASGGLPEIVEDGKTGFLYPVGDITALVEKIKELSSSEMLRTEFGLHGYRRAKEEFSLKKQIRLIKSVIDGVIAVERKAY